jgi:hypothetical protein
MSSRGSCPQDMVGNNFRLVFFYRFSSLFILGDDFGKLPVSSCCFLHFSFCETSNNFGHSYIFLKIYGKNLCDIYVNTSQDNCYTFFFFSSISSAQYNFKNLRRTYFLETYQATIFDGIKSIS